MYERPAALGVRLVIVDEPDHWSQSLVDDIPGTNWVATTIIGDPDADAAAVLGALDEARVRVDGVLTFFEDNVCEAARVALAFGLPCNPPDAVDACRSNLRTRALSARLGLPTPKAQRVRSLDELFAAAAEIGFPAVVKPEFGASAMGCIRVDSLESLPGIYKLVRDVVTPEHDTIFRAGNDLVLEEYLDGIEFDIDLVLENGDCVFSSVSQNWPTAEPSCQEAGLHCPPDHRSRPVGQLVELAVKTVQAFGFSQGVLHVEGKCTPNGPRLVEINPRVGGGRIHQILETVWDVDLIEAELRSALGLPQQLKPTRKPRCAVAHSIVYAPDTGRLTALPFPQVTSEVGLGVIIDVATDVGEEASGPDQTFATELAEVYVGAKNLRRARSLLGEVVRHPPVVEPPPTA